MESTVSLKVRGPFRVAIVSAIALAAAGGLELRSANRGGAIEWDTAAAKDLEHELMGLHESLNSMDLAAIKRKVIGDDVLVTFDVDPDTLKPVKLSSQDEILRYTQRFFDSIKKAGITSKAEHPMIACRVASGFGACTEECKVKLYMPNGTMELQQLRATVLAVRHSDGWKWIQWHMSEAGPSHPIQE
jgi:hypothetical protein